MISPDSPAATPGPWSAEYDDNGFHYIWADGMPSPYIAATGGEGETNEANARLIAAAPDLLDAVRDLVEGIELRLGERAENGWDHDNDLMARARRAIAKALAPTDSRR